MIGNINDVFKSYICYPPENNSGLNYVMQKLNLKPKG